MTTKKVKRVNVSHKGHQHPMTSHWKQQCRRRLLDTGEPLVTEEVEGRTVIVVPKPKRKRNAAAKQQAEVVDAVLDATDPATHPRDSHGRFTRATLSQWQTLLDNLEGAQAYLVDEGAELLGCSLRTRLGGHTFEAEFDGHEWSVTVAD